MKEHAETTTTTKTTTTTTVVTTEETEAVVREIREAHYHRLKKTGFGHHFYSAYMALIGFYFKHHKWSEAEILIKKTLEISWKTILSNDVTIKLCEYLIRECISVTRWLVKCYYRLGFNEKAEHIHLRIYYACLTSCSLEDDLLCESLTVRIEFYEEYHRYEQVIKIYI